MILHNIAYAARPGVKVLAQAVEMVAKDMVRVLQGSA
jgi:hypothetical protein